MSTETQEHATKIAQLVATTGLAAVRAVARDEARGNPERFKEYVALGSATLAEIASDFDDTVASFTTYVHAYVRWAIRDQQRGAMRTQRALRAVQIALRHFGATTEEPFDSFSDADARTRAQLERYVRSAVSESVLAIEAVGAEELLIAHEEKVSVQSALAELDETMRQVWQVFFVDQMTTVEGAAALGVSRATASRYKQALREELAARLAKNVDRDGDGDGDGGGDGDDAARVWK